MFGSKGKDTDDRFIVTYEQGIIDRMKIIVDTKTGVNYFFTNSGYAGGLTVLLDSDGKPVVSSVEKKLLLSHCRKSFLTKKDFLFFWRI